MKRSAFLLFAVFVLLGCESKSSHHLVTQLLRSNGALDVEVRSDVKGKISSIIDGIPIVSIRFDETNVVVIDPTQIKVRGQLWGELPAEAKHVRILFEKNEFKIEIDPSSD